MRPPTRGILPASVARDHRDVAAWAPALRGRDVVVLCQRGLKLSEGAAAWLRHEGARAEVLQGGFEAWATAGLPLVVAEGDSAARRRGPHPLGHPRASQGRPHRLPVADPALRGPFGGVPVRRRGTGAGRAERFGATPFDVEGVRWSHRGEACTFDTMLEEFGLRTPALDRLARIVRGADTARPDLAPQAAGLLAASLGLSRLHRDDLAQLEAGMGLYDALHLWCRDAVEEVHDWPSPRAA
jgi:hypothetical protein